MRRGLLRRALTPSVIVWFWLVAVPAEAQFSFLAGTPTGEAGSPQRVVISIKGGTGVGAVQFDLRFDPNQVEIRSVEQEPALASAVFGSNTPEPGRIKVAAALSQPLDGDTSLVSVVLVKQAGVADPGFTISEPRAWRHEDNAELTVRVGGGDIGRSAPPRPRRESPPATARVPAPAPARTEAPAEPLVGDPGSPTATRPRREDMGAPPTSLLERVMPWVLAALAGLALVLFVTLLALVRRRRHPMAEARPLSAGETVVMTDASRPRFCRTCGRPARNGDRFCGSCGTAL